MTSLFSRRRAAVLPAFGVLLAATALTGCGAGRHNENFLEVSSVDGAAGTWGAVQVRDAEINAPIVKGGDGILEFSLFTADNQKADTLTSVTTPLTGPTKLQLYTVSGTTATPVDSITTPMLVAGAARYAAGLVSAAAAAPSASYVTVTLTFASAGVHTLQVPVARVALGASPRVVETPGAGPTGLEATVAASSADASASATP